ncbi:hypothetical protein T4E_5825 [Trichinella pseudospiralis]|uniref:Uncharacterized protein n=1 Tax=Trichinella pseudospiralis TaxID=6337 RepID=A0A0V0YM03_TRIPS|nr:hypothetical protein T4E_5825 [Trichinella pseudospiralis]
MVKPPGGGSLPILAQQLVHLAEIDHIAQSLSISVKLGKSFVAISIRYQAK